MAPRWAHQPLSGQGAARAGGRWNRPGTPALYMSEAFTTAIAEYGQDIGIRPGTLCAYDVSGQIVDLTDPVIQTLADAPSATLLCPWKRIHLIDRRTPPTWILADRLIAEGVGGIRVPSAQDRQGVNLVLWRWNGDGGPTVTALDPLGDLPRDQQSWT